MSDPQSPELRRREAQPRAALTDRAIRAAKHGAGPSKLFDGNGLFLRVTPTSKLWQFKYRMGGKEKLASFGPYPEVSLKRAREIRDSYRESLYAGSDPMVLAREAKAAERVAQNNSFGAVAEAWLNEWSKTVTSRHAQNMRSRLNQYVLGPIGRKPIVSIEAPQLRDVILQIGRAGKVELPKRCLNGISQIFRYAVREGIAVRNPAADLQIGDLVRRPPVKHMAMIDVADLPRLLRAIDSYEGTTVTRYAMKLMAMTFVRTNELIGAKWKEFDLSKGRWNVDKDRMKMRSAHVVPLSTQAIEVLNALKTVTGHSELLFPGERDHDKPMSNNTMLKALERMGFKGTMTGHGFRSLASTQLHEKGYDPAVIEAQLSHQQRNRVAAAYNRAQYLSQREAMMQWWSDYLETATKVPRRRIVRRIKVG